MKKLVPVILSGLISFSAILSAQVPEIKTVRDARIEGQKNIKAKKYADAVKCYEAGLAVCKTPSEKQQMLAMTANVFAAERKFDQAVAKYVEASSVQGITPDEALLNMYYAGHYSILKKDDASAVKYFRQAAEIKGAKNYVRLQHICITRICGTLFSMKKYDECIKTADEGLAKITEDALKSTLLDRKAAAFAQKKDFASAQKTIAEAVQLKNITDDVRIISARRSAEFYMQERKYAKAGEVMAMAAEKFRKGKNKSLYFSSMNEAVRYYSTAKEYGKALLLVEKYEKEITLPAMKLELYLNGMLAALNKKDVKKCEELTAKAEKLLSKGNVLQKNRYYEIKGRFLAECKNDLAGAEQAYLEAAKIPGLNKNYVSALFSKVAEIHYLKKKDPAKANEYMTKAKAAGAWYNKRIDSLIQRDLKKVQK